LPELLRHDSPDLLKNAESHASVGRIVTPTIGGIVNSLDKHWVRRESDPHDSVRISGF
jgi:hypothetical protein